MPSTPEPTQALQSIPDWTALLGFLPLWAAYLVMGAAFIYGVAVAIKKGWEAFTFYSEIFKWLLRWRRTKPVRTSGRMKAPPGFWGSFWPPALIFLFGVLILVLLQPEPYLADPGAWSKTHPVGTAIACAVLLILSVAAVVTLAAARRARRDAAVPQGENIEPRIFLSQTPRDLTKLYEGRTKLQGDRLAADFIGKWLPAVTGTVRNVAVVDAGAHIVTLGWGTKPDTTTVHLRFPPDRGPHVAHLDKGEEITATGKLIEIQGVHWITLDDCEVAPRNINYDVPQVRPCLRLERAYVAAEDLCQKTPWDNKPTVTISGSVSVSGPDSAARVTNRVRPAQVARVLVQNKPPAPDSAAKAHGVTARIRFLDENGTTRVDVVNARWTAAGAIAYPAVRSDQARMDFGIDEARELDIAFKYNDETLPYALDNDVIVATSNWEHSRNMLSGKRFTVLVDLSGEWVRETFRCELLLIRPDEGQAGHIEFHALDVLSSGSELVPITGRAELGEALKGVLGEINQNLAIRLPSILDPTVGVTEPRHEHLDDALEKAGRFPLAVHAPELNDVLVQLRYVTNGLSPDVLQRSPLAILGNPYHQVARKAEEAIVNFLNESPRAASASVLPLTRGGSRVRMGIWGTPQVDAIGSNNGDPAFRVSVPVQFHNETAQPLTVHELTARVMDGTYRPVTRVRSLPPAVRLRGKTDHVDMAKGILVPPGQSSEPYWFFFPLIVPRDLPLIPTYVVEVAMRAMNQPGSTLVIECPWDRARAGPVDAWLRSVD